MICGRVEFNFSPDLGASTDRLVGGPIISGSGVAVGKGFETISCCVKAYVPPSAISPTGLSLSVEVSAVVIPIGPPCMVNCTVVFSRSYEAYSVKSVTLAVDTGITKDPLCLTIADNNTAPGI